MRPTVPSDDEDADSFRFDPILRNPFLRLAADDVDALAAAQLAAWAAREVSTRAVEGTDDWAADEETWSADVDAWVMAVVATWAAEDKLLNDVDAWSEIPGSILFRRRERTFRPIPRSGDE